MTRWRTVSWFQTYCMYFFFFFFWIQVGGLFCTLWMFMPVSTIYLLYNDLLVEEITEKHRPPINYWQIWSHKNVLSALQFDARIKLATLVIMGNDCIGRCKSHSYKMLLQDRLHNGQKKKTIKDYTARMVCRTSVY